MVYKYGFRKEIDTVHNVVYLRVTEKKKQGKVLVA
jgi:hypothetical protein